jgi:hypothetical protein
MTPQDDNAADLAFLAWLRAVGPETMATWERLYEASRTRPAVPRCEKCNGIGRIIDRAGAVAGTNTLSNWPVDYCDCKMGRDLRRVETPGANAPLSAAEREAASE